VFGEVQYLQNSFSLIFAPQRDFLTREKEFNAVLRDFYFPGQLATNAGESGPDRGLVFNSHHGHSQIVITNSNIALNVGYSTDWQTKNTEIAAYIKERVGKIFDLIEGHGDDLQMLYSGSVVRAQMVLYLAQRYLRSSSSVHLHDVNFRVTEVVEGTYFENRTVQNYRALSTSAIPVIPIRIPRNQAAERGIEVLIDFNSRYAFNEDIPLATDRDSSTRLIELSLGRMASFTESLVRGDS
jgi:hypothetical protein